MFDYFNEEEDAKPKPKALFESPKQDNILKLKSELSSAEKERRRVSKRLRHLRTGRVLEGFLSCSSDLEFIENLEESKAQPKAHALTHTQADREDNLDDIDAAMEEFLEEIDINEEDL